MEWQHKSQDCFSISGENPGPIFAGPYCRFEVPPIEDGAMSTNFATYTDGAGPSATGYAGDTTGNSSSNSSDGGYSGYSGYNNSNYTETASSAADAAPAPFVLLLKGNSLETVNKVVVVIVMLVSLATCAGLFIDRLVLRRKLAGSPADRPRGWVLGMMISTYLLLVPALICNLFSFRIGAMNGFLTFKDKQENMWQFLYELWWCKAYLGVVGVVLFAMVIPVVKLVLLVMGGRMRHSDNPERVNQARRYIHCVQVISKWASPDMFAYILLLHLIRSLNHPPTLNAWFRLDIGFTCFAFFCVFSTISSLGVRSPPKLRKHATKRANMCIALAVVVTAFIGFWCFFLVGLQSPALSLRLNFDNMVASGQIDASLVPIINSLGIVKLAESDVSILGAMWDLWDWAFCGSSSGGMELNTLVAWFVFGVFVIAFSAIDMVIILLTAVVMFFTKSRPRVLMELTHIFRKISMLDVCITGVVVTVVAGKSYEAMGVVLSMDRGVWQLALAEVFHYMAHYTVMFVGDRFPKDPAYSKEDASDSDASSDSQRIGASISEEENDNRE